MPIMWPGAAASSKVPIAGPLYANLISGHNLIVYATLSPDYFFPGTAVFVHCGVLSVGVRKQLGLPSPFDIRFGNPLDLHAAALRHPQVPIIIPHFGAGLFREALMVGDLCPNVVFDTSSSNGWIRYQTGLTLSGAFRQALAVVGPDRLLFGSDS